MKNVPPAHRFIIRDGLGSLELLWHRSKLPSRKEFDEMIESFKNGHPDLFSDNEEELDQVDLDSVNQKQFEKIRGRQEAKKRRR